MATNLIDNRQIRVFISSTFRDMQDERDYLMKRTFPKLRKIASERDVSLTELDLRWGITEEEAKNGKVIEICLREIENSIPFFIGIIGNRYGWIPSREDLGGNVTERFTDVDKYIEQHLSVTEMEMQFGVLSREEDMHAYFYIKEKEEDADYPEMLNRLKDEVRKSKYPSSNYKSPEDLAAQVEDAFIGLLDSLFPEGNLSDLEKERIGQRSFLNQLCQNYIRDEKNFKALDSWLADEDSHQLIVTGASGLGKSALIANWVKDKLYKEDFSSNIIYHFTGNGGSESSKEHISKYICNEIKDIYGYNEDRPGAESKLEDLFLRVSSEDKSLLIVIDAINQIEDLDNAKLMNWLPLPTRGIKILLSTLEDDRTMEVFKNRSYPIFTLQSLEKERRSQLVRSYLRLYAKSLTDNQVEHIVTDSQCENTLVLRTLLEELISFGIFEKLDERIEYFLASETIDDFYQTLLASYEEEYDHNGVNIIKSILSLIAVSREGLTENEIITLSGITPIYWSQFYCSFLRNFSNKYGVISFSHQYIYKAVQNRYLQNNEHKKQYHKKIITTFQNIEVERAWRELAFQYHTINDYNNLNLLFRNANVMLYFLKRNSFELWRYWQEIIANNSKYDPTIYLTDIKNDFDSLIKFSLFIKEYTGNTNVALAYLKQAYRIMEEYNKSVFFHTMGLVYTEKSNEFFRKELQILAQEGKRNSTQFADTIINVAKTNDIIGYDGIEEIDDEEIIDEIEESIKLGVIIEEQREVTDKAKAKMQLGDSIYKEFSSFSEYHFEFENNLRGDKLQLAYVDEAINTLGINSSRQDKLASYYMYIIDIMWLCDNPKLYIPYINKAIKTYESIKTKECPEVIHLLKVKAETLNEILYNNEKDECWVDGEFVDSMFINSLHLELIQITESLYGKNSIQLANAYKSQAMYYDSVEDFNSEYDCYNKALCIYSNLHLIEECNDTKKWINNYLSKKCR